MECVWVGNVHLKEENEFESLYCIVHCVLCQLEKQSLSAVRVFLIFLLILRFNNYNLQVSKST